MPARRTLLIGLGAAAAGGALPRAYALAAPSYDDPDAMYAAMAAQPHRRIALGDSALEITFADGAPGLDQAAALSWIERSAMAMTVYFGRYPVKHYRLLVIATPGSSVGHATTYGYHGSATRIHVGTAAGSAAYARDWVLVHEMVHTALPDMPRRALWLQEGNATYIEPIARAQAGQLPVEEVWRQALVGMPTGEPRAGDGGMDGTRAHDRLYWGGATFWLRAEIGIALATSGRRMLRDAMRAINRESGGNTAIWPPERVMAAGDAATGTDVLSTLYRQFAAGPMTTDLPTLFGRLGLGLREDGTVRFEETAELAALRRRITAA